MRAWMVSRDDSGVHTELRHVHLDELTDRDPGDAETIDAATEPDDVTVAVEYSSINYKDGLALTGQPGVLRRHPLIPGIDLVGTVTEAAPDSGWTAGDRVIATGWGLGETHHGGLAETARLPARWLVRLPDGLRADHAAAIGTAGFTAMLAVLALERSGSLDESHGELPVLVTGASGGVGSFAIALLAARGHRVTASTGRPQEFDYLRALGADEVIPRDQFASPGKPLQSQRWRAAIDSVGGTTLANVLAQTVGGGAVAACGLASGSDLPATVMPFILRAVTLTGINSVYIGPGTRREAWRRLAEELSPAALDRVMTVVPLTSAHAVAERILAGQVRGRTVVDVRA